MKFYESLKEPVGACNILKLCGSTRLELNSWLWLTRDQHHGSESFVLLE